MSHSGKHPDAGRELMSNVWDYRDSTWTDGYDLAGYDVQATDGSIGNVDQATNDVSNAYVVVDTGFWIFGKKRLVPAGAISSVEHDDKKLYVNMTKDQIKDAPDYDAEHWTDDTRTQHGEYYGRYSTF
jgi:hypothetical protein